MLQWHFLAGSLTSCKEKLKNMDGVVTQVETSNLCDTVKSMKLYNGEDTLIFNLMDAEYNNGFDDEGRFCTGALRQGTR